MVECTDLWLTYPGASQASVAGVSLRVEEGEFVTLLGPSGCGKTSMLRSIAGLESPSRGAVTIGATAVFDSAREIDVPTHARDISMVFQSYAVWPHMTVAQNIAFPLEVARLPRAEVERRVVQVLEMVGLQALAARSATQLSGGQQQRVAIARALVRRSTAILLDEPLSNLDAKLREQMRLELRQLLKSIGLTAIYVTHDQEEALMLSDRIALMNAGRLVEVGTPLELYFSPRTLFGATFLGAAEVFEVMAAQASSVEIEAGTLQLARAAGGLRHVAIRPEAIIASQDPGRPGRPNVLTGRLVSVVFSGRQQQLIVELPSGRRLSVLAEPTASFQVGKTITLELPPERLMGLAGDDA